MKKLLPLSLCLTLMFSCSETGTNNNWTTEEKDNFMIECKAALPEFNEPQKTEYCSCVLGLSMQEWDNSLEGDEAVLNMTMNEITEFVTPCLDQLE